MDLRLFCFAVVLQINIFVTGKTVKKKLSIDIEHLKQDFSRMFGLWSWKDLLSDAEMDFRYFHAHDEDNNKKLDGLELLTALEHDAKHDAEAHDGEAASREELEREVEAIFMDHDKDGDGYLDYKEFMTVHKTRPDISGERKRSTQNQELR